MINYVSFGPTGDHCEDVESVNEEADLIFFNDKKYLPSHKGRSKEIRKLKVFSVVRAIEPFINEYFCRSSYYYYKIKDLNQNIFLLDRQSVR